jgi:hypothetical protein
MTEPPPLTWRNVSTPNLRDFISSDRGREVARIYQTPHRPEEWRWSVYAICPAVPGVTGGYETDPKEARRKVAAWQMAKENRLRDPQGRLIE